MMKCKMTAAHQGIRVLILKAILNEYSSLSIIIYYFARIIFGKPKYVDSLEYLLKYNVPLLYQS